MSREIILSTSFCRILDYLAGCIGESPNTTLGKAIRLYEFYVTRVRENGKLYFVDKDEIFHEITGLE